MRPVPTPPKHFLVQPQASLLAGLCKQENTLQAVGMQKVLNFLGLVQYSHFVDSCRTTLSNRLSDCCIEMLSGVTITVITFNFE